MYDPPTHLVLATEPTEPPAEPGTVDPTIDDPGQACPDEILPSEPTESTQPTTPPPPPPRPALLQRLATTRAATLVSFAFALGLHAGVIALAWVHYASPSTLDLPELSLPQGWAADSEGTIDTPHPAHPSVTFVGTLPSFNREAGASASATQTPTREFLKPPAADFAPPTAPDAVELDLALGTTAPPPPPPLATAASPSPHRQRAPLTTPGGAESSSAPSEQSSPRTPGSSPSPTNTASAPASNSTAGSAPEASAAQGAPQGTPDTPPAPSAHNKVPPYPPDALRRGLAGTVVLELHIDPAGRVTRALIQQSSGHEPLDRSARETALTWRFSPARLNGRPVPISVLRPVNFIPPR